ncbi:MAG: YceI family protein [Burkholderiaceae bacterium]|nr:YceI family protein [Burkholderiaceae bacterium]
MTQAAPDAVETHYRRAEAAGETVLRIDARRSLISIVARRGGRLARLGHDHVIASRTLEGFVAPEQGRADLRFRLDQLTIDEPELRAGAGLDTVVSDAAREGTRRNMLDKVLDAERFPDVLIHATRVAGADTLAVAITLHGVTRSVDIPVEMESRAGPAADAGLTVSGATSLKQSDFGITPFSVLGGALAVQDQLELRFKIVAAPRPGE